MTEMQLTRCSSGTPSSRASKENIRSIILEELYSRHSAMLYKIALRKLGNPADAEDALQDALLSAFRHFDQFKGDANISTWLTAIVLNMARMQLRRRLNRRFISLEGWGDAGFAMSETIADTAPDPEQIRQRIQLREVLERLVIKLSPKIRPAFRLRVLEGLTTRETADRLGISETALKAQFFRARRQITPLLEKAFVSPVKSTKQSRRTQMCGFVPQGAAVSPVGSTIPHGPRFAPGLSVVRSTRMSSTRLKEGEINNAEQKYS